MMKSEGERGRARSGATARRHRCSRRGCGPGFMDARIRSEPYGTGRRSCGMSLRSSSCAAINWVSMIVRMTVGQLADDLELGE